MTATVIISPLTLCTVEIAPVEQATVELALAGVGVKGAKGDPGTSGGTGVSLEAVGTVRAGAPVCVTVAGGCEEADPSNSKQVMGIANSETLTGFTCQIISAGETSQADWTEITGAASLSVGSPYFLSGAGQLATTPPASGRVVCIGVATASDTLMVGLQPSVLLV